MSLVTTKENQNIYLGPHSHLLLMRGKGEGCLLHIHLEQGLAPFHLKERKKGNVDIESFGVAGKYKQARNDM